MKRISSVSDYSRRHGVITFELPGGFRIDIDEQAVRDGHAEDIVRAAGHEPWAPGERDKRIPVIQEGRLVGSLPAWFDPWAARSLSFLFDIRDGDYVRKGDTWIAHRTLGPGDLDCTPGFQREPVGLDLSNPAALIAAVSGDGDNFVTASTPGGVQAQEREGQAALTQALTRLPKAMDREMGEERGFVYGEDFDDIFVNVTAPAGWTLRPTAHPLHSEILDDTGTVRGTVFFKAAFYDRRASGHWL